MEAKKMNYYLLKDSGLVAKGYSFYHWMGNRKEYRCNQILRSARFSSDRSEKVRRRNYRISCHDGTENRKSVF